MTPAIEAVAFEVLRRQLLADEVLEAALPARVTGSRIWQELVAAHGGSAARAAAALASAAS